MKNAGQREKSQIFFSFDCKNGVEGEGVFEPRKGGTVGRTSQNSGKKRVSFLPRNYMSQLKEVRGRDPAEGGKFKRGVQAGSGEGNSEGKKQFSGCLQKGRLGRSACRSRPDVRKELGKERNYVEDWKKQTEIVKSSLKVCQ